MHTPVPDHDIFTIIEYWGFRIGLLTVFMIWVLEHVVHALIHILKTLILAFRELRDLCRPEPKSEPPKVIPNSSP